MAFTKLTTTQKQFLEEYLRGTNRTLSSRQAAATYGIKNLRARICEMRKAGLRIYNTQNTEGRTAYQVSRRTVDGTQGRLF